MCGVDSQMRPVNGVKTAISQITIYITNVQIMFYWNSNTSEQSY